MTNPEELIAGHLDGALTAEQHRELEQWLWADADHVRQLTEALMFEQEIRSAAQAGGERVAAESFAERGEPAWRSRAPGWRPWTAAVAGLVVGLFSASVVWAVSTQVGAARWQGLALWLANPGFEEAQDLPQVPLVAGADQWAGITTEIVEGGAGRPLALEGRRMMKLGPAPEGRGYFASLIVDLEEQRPVAEGRLSLQVSAAYHASVAGQDEHYSLLAATFKEAPEEVGGLWSGNTSRQALQEQALTLVHRAAFPKADEPGWHRVTVTVEVPPQARSLVISLGSNTPGPVAGRTDHFMDDVRAVWMIPPTPDVVTVP